MVELDPKLQLLAHIRLSLARGHSFKACLRDFCQRNHHSLSTELGYLILDFEQQRQDFKSRRTMGSETQVLFELIWRVLRGNGQLNHFASLEEELSLNSQIRMESFLKSLPLKALLVVMLLHVPALLILVLIPIFKHIQEILL